MFRPLLAVAVVVVATITAAAGAAAPTPAVDSRDALHGSTQSVEPSASAASSNGSLPDPSADRLGWEAGYRYNSTVDVTRANGLNDSELDAVVARSMARVERIRRLEFQRTPPVEVISRETYVREYVDGTTSPSRRTLANLTYEALFMINESTDAVAVRNENLAGGVLGFYDPSSGEIRIVSENASTPKMDEITLAQELFHALQDQHYDLSAFDQSTRELHNAKDGIVEGDGNYVDYLYEQRCAGEWDCLEPTGRRVPADYDPHVGLTQITLQPYSSGPAFVRGLRREGGWEAVNAVYDEPPASTEQTIHPAKYPEDDPAAVSISDRSADEWRPLRVDGRPDYASVGEAGLFVALWYPAYETGGTASIVPLAAHYNYAPGGGLDPLAPYRYDHPATTGWEGDRLVPYVARGTNGTGAGGDGTGYVYRTVWESPADAWEFRRAYGRLLANHGATAVENRSDTYRIPDDREFGDAFYVNATGDTVVVVNAPTVEELSAVRSGAGTTGGPPWFDGVAAAYDLDGDGNLTITELGAAAAAYVRGDLSVRELGRVAAAYAS